MKCRDSKYLKKIMISQIEIIETLGSLNNDQKQIEMQDLSKDPEVTL